MNGGIFPGPVPLDDSGENAKFLFGREQDVDQIVNLIRTRRVIEVTAPSGTGKSSLLMAGVIPRLANPKGYNFTVAAIRNWAEVSSRDNDPVSYYYEAIQRAFTDTHIDTHRKWDDDPRAGFDLLRDEYGDRLVLIFDQLEELLRLDPRQGQEFIATVRDAARQLPFRQVLSLRSEYKEELRILENTLPRADWEWHRVGTVARDTETIIVTKPPELAGYTIAPAAAERVLEVWRKAGGQNSPTVGLLYLQAMLWVIENQARPKRGETLDIESLATRSSLFRTIVDSEQDAESVTRDSFHTYTEMRINDLEDRHKHDACGNEITAKETRFVIAHIADGLASAGYKTSREANELFFEGFDDFDDVSSCGWKKEPIDDLLELVGEWRRGSMDHRLPTPHDILRLARDNAIKGDDIGIERGASAGRIARCGILEAIAEAISTFERAVSWLEKASIIRITKDRCRRRMITLVHDGYGNALDSWAKPLLDSPERYIDSLFGVRGRRVLVDVTIQDREIRSLWWQSCQCLRAIFRNIQFSDCDLSDVTFRGCTFENVVFEECDLSGAEFVDCDFTGRNGCEIHSGTTRRLAVTETRFDGKGFTIRDSINGADGLFLDGVSGPWSVESCKFRHLSVTCSGNPQSARNVHGSILNSELAHVFVASELGPTKVVASTIKYSDFGAGGITSDGSDPIRLS